MQVLQTLTNNLHLLPLKQISRVFIQLAMSIPPLHHLSSLYCRARAWMLLLPASLYMVIFVSVTKETAKEQLHWYQ